MTGLPLFLLILLSFFSLSASLSLRDGLISKDEMIAYFLRANPLLQCKMGPGFIHNFQEMTYLKPTFCEHCAGFVCISKILSLHVPCLLNFAPINENLQTLH